MLRWNLRCKRCTRAAALADDQHGLQRRSRKPVRSRNFTPASPDPQDEELDVLAYLTAVEQPTQSLLEPSPAWRSYAPQPTHQATACSLPAAYQVLQQQHEAAVHMESEAPLPAGGFFFRDKAQLLEAVGAGTTLTACKPRVQLQRQKAQQPPEDRQAARLLLEYRYMVDEDGQLVDMVKAKRAVPATFQNKALAQVQPVEQQQQQQRHQQQGESDSLPSKATARRGRFLHQSPAKPNLQPPDILQEST